MYAIYEAASTIMLFGLWHTMQYVYYKLGVYVLCAWIRVYAQNLSH